jgi:hypothetical protein
MDNALDTQLGCLSLSRSSSSLSADQAVSSCELSFSPSCPHRALKSLPVLSTASANTPSSPPGRIEAPAEDTISTSPFHLTRIPGKGEGFVATRKIDAGEILLIEKPIIRYSKFNPCQQPLRLFSLLSLPDRVAFLNLPVAPHHAFLVQLCRICAICATNAYQVGPTSAGERGVFLQGSRFNHSCRPVVCKNWDVKKQAMVFVASETIEKGQELTTYFVFPTLPKAQREETLARQFGFKCSCEVCSLTGEEATNCDQRRLLAEAILNKYSTIVKSADPLEDLKMIKAGLAIMAFDRIHPDRRNLAEAAATICAHFGDLENAKSWLQLTLDFEALESGKDLTEYRAVKKRLEDPTKLAYWGRWGKKTLVGPA